MTVALIRPVRFLISTSCLLAVVGVGCRNSPAEHRLAADEQVYGIVETTQRETLGEAGEFSIDTAHSGLDPESLTAGQVVDERDVTPEHTLDLAGALALATANSRTYQSRKEDLYLAALTLTASRHEFEPTFGGTGSVGYEREEQGDQRGTAGADWTFTQALQSGANISVGIANDLLRYTTGDPRVSATTVLSFSITQPLLKGMGREIAAENLLQAERNVVYQVREFARFQQTFAVEIAESYYRLLQQRDTVRNEYVNYQNLIRARERAEALSVDRLPAFQVDQTRQDELNARNRYVLAVTNYQAALDDFKRQLGLPLGAQIRLEDRDLQVLVDGGLQPFVAAERPAVMMARRQRLDLLNDYDRFDDARRQIRVKADDLRPGLDLQVDGGMSSVGPASFEEFHMADYTLSGALQFDLPFDRLDERNAYRRSLIDFERRLRTLTEAADGVRDDVRRGIRQLDDTRQRYSIQRRAVDLAQRRVESANLLLAAGRAETRDLLEAQNALLRAKNDLTQVLVDYHLARLRLLRDLGALELTPTGIVELPAAEAMAPAAAATPDDQPVITPDELFGG